MPERENKNLEELQKDRLQAEISKIKAETDKLSKEREEIEKRVNQKWYFGRLAFRITGLVLAIILIVAALVSIIIPLTQSSIQIAKNKNRIAEMRLDSVLVEKARAVSLLEKAKAKEDSLQALVELKSTQLDSVTRQHRAEIEVLKERSKGQTDKNIIAGLRSNIESLEKQIESNESYKEQITKLVAAPSELSILSGRVLTKYDDKILPLAGVLVSILGGSVSDTTNENGNFKLEIPTTPGSSVELVFSKPGYTDYNRVYKKSKTNIKVFLEKNQ